MLVKFAIWFACLDLSFLLESVGGPKQEKAFLSIYLVIIGLFIALLNLVFIFVGDGLGERIGIPLIATVIYGAEIAIILFATWGTTKLFNVDYYVAFQIMTFGKCLCFTNKEVFFTLILKI